MHGVNDVQLFIVVGFFLLVSVMGFVAARWRRAQALDNLDEWGLGGRNFGSWITWFLLGGDLYTAYTFVAVPALVFAVGALGFFAVPYTIILVSARAARRRADVVGAAHARVRHAGRLRAGPPRLERRSRWLVAITGIVATMPYIALQLVGIQAVLKTIGIAGQRPLILAFAMLAAYTYRRACGRPRSSRSSRTRSSTSSCWWRSSPSRSSSAASTRSSAPPRTSSPPRHRPRTAAAGNAATLGYSTLAFGSALALFLYPHSMTGILAARNRDTIKRNMVALPLYSLALGLMALLGYMAIAAGVKPIDGNRRTRSSRSCSTSCSRDWFAGVAFAAICIGALVPAAIMSIAAANLFTRNIYREYLNRTRRRSRRRGLARSRRWWSRSAR